MAGKIKTVVVAEGVSVTPTSLVDVIDGTTNQTVGGVKTFTSQVNLPEIATPTTPAAGAVSVYAKSDKKLYKKASDGIESEIGSGAGAGGINYCTNGDAETNVTTGWATYADAAATTPVDGTGGSPNSTFAASASSPLRGTYSFLFTKNSGASRQGEGYSFAFTLADADKGRPIGITFEGEASANYTGSTGTEYMVCYVYDVTNATLIATSNVNIGPGSSKFFTSFVATTSTSYRAIFHVAGTGTAAWTYKIDTVKFSPEIIVQGAAVTDSVVFTPALTVGVGSTPAVGTAGVTSGTYRQVGDRMIGHFLWLWGSSGNTFGTSGNYGLTIPGGKSIDLSKIASSANGYAEVGSGFFYDASASDMFGISVQVTNAGVLQFYIEESITGVALGVAAPVTHANSDYFSIDFDIPITGWSSNVTMANRAVEEYASNSSTSTTANDSTSFTYGSSGNQIQSITATLRRSVTFQTTPQPTDVIILEVWDGTSGKPWQQVDSTIIGGNSLGFQNQNGVSYGMGLTKSHLASEHATVQFGTYAYNTSTYGAGTTSWSAAGLNTYYWRVKKVAAGSVVGYPISPANIVKSLVRYSTAAAQSIPNSSTVQQVDYGTKVFDTKSEVTTGASWKFTAKEAGYYRVTALATLTSTATFISAEYFVIGLYKNGTLVSNLELFPNNAATIEPCIQINDVIQLVATDFIDIRVAQTNGSGALTLINSATYNYVCIEQIG